jgi:hypothetical protein
LFVARWVLGCVEAISGTLGVKFGVSDTLAIDIEATAQAGKSITSSQWNRI